MLVVENLGRSENAPRPWSPTDCLEVADSGTIFFNDLLYPGFRAPRGAPPKSVLEDPICARGIQELRRLQPEIILVLGAHDSAQDFRRAIAQCGKYFGGEIVAVEATFSSNATAANKYKARQFALELSEAKGRRRYQRAQFGWMQANGKIVLPLDIDTPNTPLRQRMAELDAFTDNLETTEQKLVNLAVQHTREAMMPGQLGEWLGLVDEMRARRGEEPLPKGLPIPYMVGTWHPALRYRFQYFGAPTTFEVVSDDDEQSTGEFAGVFAEVMRTGYMTPEQQRVPWPTWD